MHRKLTMLSLIIAWYLNMICCLERIDILDQDLYASLAELTAASISDLVALGTLVTTSFVAGLWTSIHSLV